MKKLLLIPLSLFLASCNKLDYNTYTAISNKPEAITSYKISENLKNEFISEINKARGQEQFCGEFGYKDPVNSVKWNTKLFNASLEHSLDMASINTMKHKGSNGPYDITAKELGLNNGSSLIDRTNFHKYPTTYVGEDILYANYKLSTREAVKVWLNSPHHCIILMNKHFTDFGLSLAKSKQGLYFWTLDMGSNRVIYQGEE